MNFLEPRPSREGGGGRRDPFVASRSFGPSGKGVHHSGLSISFSASSYQRSTSRCVPTLMGCQFMSGQSATSGARRRHLLSAGRIAPDQVESLFETGGKLREILLQAPLRGRAIRVLSAQVDRFIARRQPVAAMRDHCAAAVRARLELGAVPDEAGRVVVATGFTNHPSCCRLRLLSGVSGLCGLETRNFYPEQNVSAAGTGNAKLG